MKTQGVRWMSLLVLMAGWISVFGQQQAEVPGDHFSLEGALELFKKSKSPQEFEQFLNSPDGKVNNLDLNGDGDIDYIKVIDRNEGNVHAFILQAVVSETESQDVAVIELEKLANGKAVLQITGDADVYGTETIIEPTEEVRVNAGTSTARNVVNVWTWPSVQYVYDPYYTAWNSPWGWYSRPIWWSPWRPVAYYVYDPYWASYRPYYSVCYTHRYGYGQIYRPYRTTSVIVINRHNTQINNYRSTHDNDRNGRTRYDDRNNGRRDKDSYVVESTRSPRSVSPQEGRHSDLSRYRTDDRTNRRPSVNRESALPSRSTPDVNSRPNVSERRSSDLPRTRAVAPSAPSRQWSGGSSIGDKRSNGNAVIQRPSNPGGATKAGGHKRGRN